MYLSMCENMVANGKYEKISIGRVLVSVSTPHLVTFPKDFEEVKQRGVPSASIRYSAALNDEEGEYLQSCVWA